MSTFQVPILRIDDVYDHPNAERLSIIRVRGYECVAGKMEDGSHRFAKGEAIIYVPEAAVVPDKHLKDRGYWHATKDIGLLAGTRGNRVKAITLRGCLSQGLVWKTETVGDQIAVTLPVGDAGARNVKFVDIGDDVSSFLEIVKYEAPVPPGLDGDVMSLYDAAFNFDIENIKAYPNFFTEDDTVTVTEKLHGSFVRMSYLPAIEPHEDLFGDGRVVITTKGLGADGLVFKNTQHNRAKTAHVRVLLPLIDRFVSACQQDAKNMVVHLMGEVFGPGVQDLHYGLEESRFAGFEVWIEGDGYLTEDAKEYAFIAFGVERVPVLFEGFYDADLIRSLAEGDTTIEGDPDKVHIREGVIVTLTDSQVKRDDGNGLGGTLRPILKVVSPAYLTRKGGTEHQ